MANGREDYQLRAPRVGPRHAFTPTTGCRATPALRVACKNTYSSSDGGNASMDGAACVSDRGPPVPLTAAEYRPKATSDSKNSSPQIHGALTVIPFIFPIGGIAAGTPFFPGGILRRRIILRRHPRCTVAHITSNYSDS